MSGSPPTPPSNHRDDTLLTPDMDEYRRLYGSAGSFLHVVSPLRITGEEIPDFLHRISTNDLSHLKAGETRKTVLVNEKGRVIDLVQVCMFSGSVLLIGSGENGWALGGWLKKFIIMEDITVAPASEPGRAVMVIGPEGPKYLSRITPDFDPEGTTSFAQVTVAGQEAIVYRDDRWEQPVFMIVFPEPPPDFDAKIRSPESEGLIPPAISPATFETVRIEHGIPLLDRELTPEVNALEAGLKRYISFSKGCYIGQEVIARLDTYNKLQRLLSLFLLHDTDPQSVGSEGQVFMGDAVAGRITSACYSPKYEHTLGLGYRRKGLAGEGAVFVPEGTERRIPVTLPEFALPGYEAYEVTDEEN